MSNLLDRAALTIYKAQRKDGAIEIPTMILSEIESLEYVSISVHPHSLTINLNKSGPRLLKKGFRVSKSLLKQSRLDGKAIKISVLSDKIVFWY